MSYMSYQSSKKTSELNRINNIEMVKGRENQLWIPLAYYNSLTNSYVNLAINLKTIISHDSYSYIINNSYIINDNNSITQSELNEIYNNCYSYITDIYVNKLSYLIQNQKERRQQQSSYTRNNSKKISELDARETITYHQDHSWFPVAQYDSRISSYHNIAMNLKSITSYSIENIDNKYKNIYELDNLSYDGYNNEQMSYIINNSNIANNLVSYTVSYSRDYFEWQFL